MAILALPFVAVVIIPAIILVRPNDIRVIWNCAMPLNIIGTLFAAGLIGFGFVLFFKTVSLFAIVGQGTLAPWDPPQKLVVRGIYRHVRNPMITGVLAILLGEAILFASLSLLFWSVFFLLLNAIYIPFVEEPSLERHFGQEYAQYKKHVPRWIPRLKPWEAE